MAAVAAWRYQVARQQLIAVIAQLAMGNWF
jgi:hypothetical protein